MIKSKLFITILFCGISLLIGNTAHAQVAGDTILGIKNSTAATGATTSQIFEYSLPTGGTGTGTFDATPLLTATASYTPSGNTSFTLNSLASNSSNYNLIYYADSTAGQTGADQNLVANGGIGTGAGGIFVGSLATGTSLRLTTFDLSGNTSGSESPIFAGAFFYGDSYYLFNESAEVAVSGNTTTQVSKQVTRYQLNAAGTSLVSTKHYNFLTNNAAAGADKTNIGNFGDIAIDRTTGISYGSAIGYGGTTSYAGTTQFFSIDFSNINSVADNSTLAVNGIGLNPLSYQLAVTDDGHLFGVSGTTGTVVQLNKATGAVVNTLTNGFGFSVGDAANGRFAVAGTGVVPEPGSLSLLGLGVSAFLLRRRRKA